MGEEDSLMGRRQRAALIGLLAASISVVLGVECCTPYSDQSQIYSDARPVQQNVLLRVDAGHQLGLTQYSDRQSAGPEELRLVESAANVVTDVAPLSVEALAVPRTVPMRGADGRNHAPSRGEIVTRREMAAIVADWLDSADVDNEVSERITSAQTLQISGLLSGLYTLCRDVPRSSCTLSTGVLEAICAYDESRRRVRAYVADLGVPALDSPERLKYEARLDGVMQSLDRLEEAGASEALLLSIMNERLLLTREKQHE